MKHVRNNTWEILHEDTLRVIASMAVNEYKLRYVVFVLRSSCKSNKQIVDECILVWMQKYKQLQKKSARSHDLELRRMTSATFGSTNYFFTQLSGFDTTTYLNAMTRSCVICHQHVDIYKGNLTGCCTVGLLLHSTCASRVLVEIPKDCESNFDGTSAPARFCRLWLAWTHMPQAHPLKQFKQIESRQIIDTENVSVRYLEMKSTRHQRYHVYI